jgi:hypothetical protein
MELEGESDDHLLSLTLHRNPTNGRDPSQPCHFAGPMELEDESDDHILSLTWDSAEKRFVSTNERNPSHLCDLTSSVGQENGSDDDDPTWKASENPFVSKPANDGHLLFLNGSNKPEHAFRYEHVFGQENSRLWDGRKKSANSVQQTFHPRHGDFEHAVRQQLEFDEEDRRLQNEQRELANLVQPTFHCGICLETCAEDDVARVHPCAHAFCRNCMKSYISSMLKEPRFPIFCPNCTSESSNREPSGNL